VSISTISETAPQRSVKAWWKELWVQVMIAMAFGVALGIYRPDFAIQMQPFGDAFIKAIRMLIAPIIFCTVVNGVAHMADMARVGRVAIKSIIYFEAITTSALIIGLVAVNLWQPGAGMNVDAASINSSIVEPYVKQTAVLGFVPFLLNVIPNTFVGAFSEGNILQVLFLSATCGFALIRLGERAKPLTDVIDVVAKMVFGVVRIVMWAAPLGAFGAIAFTVAKFGLGSLASLGKLVGGFYVTCIFFIAVVFGPIAAFCGFSLLKLIRYIWEQLLVCVATTSSETVLPRIITKLGNAGCDSGIVGLVVPMGYSFNLDGTCLYFGDRFCLPGPGDEHAFRFKSPGRASAHFARYVERCCRYRRCGVRGACGHARCRRHHPGRECGARARRTSSDVAGADADQSARQRLGNDRHRKMGKCSGPHPPEGSSG
jgi:aerobic C4-dicarboxylate transport protein